MSRWEEGRKEVSAWLDVGVGERNVFGDGKERGPIGSFRDDDDAVDSSECSGAG